MSEKLACPKCGSRNTVVKNKGELNSISGFVGEEIISRILDMIKDYTQKILICKDCGHFEKL